MGQVLAYEYAVMNQTKRGPPAQSIPGREQQIWFDLWDWQAMGFGTNLFYSLNFRFHICKSRQISYL